MVVRSSVFFSQYKRYEWTRVYVYRYRSICMCLQLNSKFVDWITHPFRDLLNSYLSLKESPRADTVYNVPESVLSPTWMQYWRVQVSLHLRIQVFRLAALIERFRKRQLAPAIIVHGAIDSPYRSCTCAINIDWLTRTDITLGSQEYYRNVYRLVEVALYISTYRYLVSQW